MSASALAAISALDNRAEELQKACHYARAAEKRGAAVAAAQALGHADCLIVALLQTQEATDLFANASAQHVDLLARFDGLRRAVELTRAAVAVLKRRKAAGTLLPGACRPVEEAWNAGRLLHRAGQAAGKRNAAMQMYASMATPFVGYEAYLLAASVADVCACGTTGADEAEAVTELLTFVGSAIELRPPAARPAARCRGAAGERAAELRRARRV